MASASDIRALLFDLGHVIVRVDEERTARALADFARLSPQQVVERVKGSGLRQDFQEGRLPPEHWHDWVSKQLGLRMSYREFCDAWNLMLDREPILAEEMFKQLSPNYRLLTISNTDPIHVAWMEENLDLLHYFPNRIYSCVVGASKPNSVIYQVALQKAGVKPNQVFYVDDMPEYVEAGRRAGFEVYRFQGAQELEQELRSRKILPESGPDPTALVHLF